MINDIRPDLKATAAKASDQKMPLGMDLAERLSNARRRIQEQ